MKFTPLGLSILAAAAVLARETPVPPAADLVVRSSEKDGSVEIEGNHYTAKNGVVVQYGDSTLTGQTVTLDQSQNVVLADGDVTIQFLDKQGRAQLWRGESVRFNYVTKSIEAAEFRVGQPPFFAKGHQLKAGKNRAQQVAENAVITTDDLAEPGYHIRAKRMILIPGRVMTAEQATLYVGDTPVMYFPTYSRSLERHPNFWTLTPGYRSLYGPFALTGYHYFWSTNVETVLNLDWRQKRGIGVGPEINYDLGKAGKGTAEFYYTRDDAPGVDAAGNPIPSNRHRTTFTHEMEPWDGFNAKAVVREQSDPLVVHDFYESEFRRDTQPKSFFEASEFWRNFSLDAMVQPQINDFFRTVERLPDVKLTGLRQQIWDTPAYYETESSLAYLRYREGLLGSGVATNFSAMRADTLHQIVVPQTFFGFLNFTPRVGGRYTYYGDPDGLPVPGGARDRWVFNTGAELSFKASRVWPGIRNDTLDVTGIRHIIEPSLNYAFVPKPDRQPWEIPQFDQELPSHRLLPLEFPDYNSIDSVDSQNTIRIGLRNKIQTKRTNAVENVINWAVYTDWRLQPNVNQTTFPDLYSDLDFSPRSWAVFNSQVRYDINGRDWRESNHRLTLLPNDVWNWTLGHRYLKDDPTPGGYGPGNNLMSSSLYYKINEDWAFRFSHYFEARDGVLEEQYYTIYRDLRSWTAALTLRLRDNRQATADWAIVLTLQLKAFPRFGLGKDTDRADWLLGR